MLIAHSILVKIFLGFLVVGLVIPLMTKNNALGFKKASFVYTMVFQALITMIAFAGIVAIFTGDLPWSMTTIIMLVMWAILMFIEIKKHKVIKLANLSNNDTFALLRGAFIKIGLIQILLVALMVVLMILKAKGIVSF